MLKKGRVSRLLYRHPTFLLLSFPFFPFLGWKHYPFLISIENNDSESGSENENENDENSLGEIHFLSLGSKSKAMKVVVRFFLNTSGSGSGSGSRVYIQTTTSTRGISNKERDVVVDTLMNDFLRPLVNQSHDLLRSRQKLIIKHSQQSRQTKESKRKKQLDRIIHPEKYKSHIGTVRRSGDSCSSGNGRWAPSAATQARRSRGG
eukprot:gene5591-6155_t